METRPHLPIDPDATVAEAEGFLFDADEQAKRQVLPPGDLRARLSALIRSCEGCENVAAPESQA